MGLIYKKGKSQNEYIKTFSFSFIFFSSDYFVHTHGNITLPLLLHIFCKRVLKLN